MFKVLYATVAGNIPKCSLFFSQENKAWYFMWIVCLVDNSHEMSSFIYKEKMDTTVLNEGFKC